MALGILQRTKVLAKALVDITRINMLIILAIIMLCTLQCVDNLILKLVHMGIGAGNGTFVGLVRRQEN